MQLDTLTGGRVIQVLSEGSQTQEDVLVRQIPVKEFEAAFLQLDDEMALTALICGKPKSWIQNLTPESYELTVSAAQEVNAKGFFKYAQRRSDGLVAKLNSLKPEILQMANGRVSSNSSLGLQPRLG